MKKNLIRRLSAIILAVAIFAGAFPVCFADNTSSYFSRDDRDIMDYFSSSVQRPRSTAILDVPEKKIVKSYYGNLIHVLSAPGSKAKKLGKAYEGEEVTVYAIQDGYALAIVNNSNMGGWMKANLLAYEEDYYDYSEGPNPSDTENLEKGVQRPVKDQYISEYETMYVKSKHGICIYLCYEPSKSSEAMGKIYEAEEVTVIARCSGYAFVRTGSGRLGWCNGALLTYRY